MVLRYLIILSFLANCFTAFGVDKNHVSAFPTPAPKTSVAPTPTRQINQNFGKVSMIQFDRKKVVPKEDTRGIKIDDKKRKRKGKDVGVYECEIPRKPVSKFPLDRLSELKKTPISIPMSFDGQMKAAIQSSLRHVKRKPGKKVKVVVHLDAIIPHPPMSVIEGAKKQLTEEWEKKSKKASGPEFDKYMEEYLSKRINKVWFGPDQVFQMYKKSMPKGFKAIPLYTGPVDYDFKNIGEGEKKKFAWVRRKTPHQIQFNGKNYSVPKRKKAMRVLDKADVIIVDGGMSNGWHHTLPIYMDKYLEANKKGKLLMGTGGWGVPFFKHIGDRTGSFPSVKRQRNLWNSYLAKPLIPVLKEHAPFNVFHVPWEAMQWIPPEIPQSEHHKYNVVSTRIGSWRMIDGFKKKQLHRRSRNAELAKRAHAFEPLDRNMRSPLKLGFGHGVGTVADFRKPGSIVLKQTEKNAKLYIYSANLLPSKKPRCDVWYVRSDNTTILFDDETGNFDVYETPRGVAYHWQPFKLWFAKYVNRTNLTVSRVN